MKITLLNVVLASTLAAAPLLPAKQTVENSTPFRASVRVAYAACRGESFTLAPGKSHTVDGRACLVTGVTATVYTKESGNAAETSVEAIPFKSSGIAGNSTWQITGPTSGKYSVVRKTK